jgi:hypothetical protein
MQALNDEGRVPTLTLLLPSSPRGSAGRALALGFACHVVLVACIAIATSFASRPSAPPIAENLDRRPLPTFVAAPPEPEEKQPQRDAPGGSTAPIPPASSDQIPLEDTGRLEITFAPDHGGTRLREVMERRGGVLGFASPAQVEACQTKPQGPDVVPGGCYFEHRLSAPDWAHGDQRQFSFDGYFVVRIDALPQYIDQLRARYAIARSYRVYALLPEDMRLAIDDEIAEQLARTNESAVKVATRVEIAFSAAVSRGFTLRIVATRPKPAGPHGAARQRDEAVKSPDLR